MCKGEGEKESVSKIVRERMSQEERDRGKEKASQTTARIHKNVLGTDSYSLRFN